MPARSESAAGEARLEPLLRALLELREQHPDMTLTELIALLAVAVNPGVTVRSAGRICGFKEATASRALRRMAPEKMPGSLGAQRGLVQLMQGPLDGRTRHAFLTPMGERLCEVLAGSVSIK